MLTLLPTSMLMEKNKKFIVRARLLIPYPIVMVSVPIKTNFLILTLSMINNNIGNAIKQNKCHVSTTNMAWSNCKNFQVESFQNFIKVLKFFHNYEMSRCLRFSITYKKEHTNNFRHIFFDCVKKPSKNIFRN